MFQQIDHGSNESKIFPFPIKISLTHYAHGINDSRSFRFYSHATGRDEKKTRNPPVVYPIDSSEFSRGGERHRGPGIAITIAGKTERWPARSLARHNV